jgi:hypothetical protein
LPGTHHKPISAKKLAGPDDLQNCSDNRFQDKIAKKNVQINQPMLTVPVPSLKSSSNGPDLQLAALLDALWTSVGRKLIRKFTGSRLIGRLNAAHMPLTNGQDGLRVTVLRGL